MRSTVLLAALSAGLMATAAPAFAQAPSPKPLPFLVVDFRAARASIGRDTTTAEDLDVDTSQLPGSGFAFSGGLHVYPFRRHGFAIGVGAEGISTGATRLNSANSEGVVTAELKRRLTGVSGVISLNFGGRDGWSYLSGGLGPLRFESTSSEVPHGEAPYTMTQNAGGGARWFINRHLAAGFDLRFYLTRPSGGLADVAGRNRLTVRVIAIGVTFR
jgi:hypothetical protein